jgi:hypothetical protein
MRRTICVATLFCSILLKKKIQTFHRVTIKPDCNFTPKLKQDANQSNRGVEMYNELIKMILSQKKYFVTNHLKRIVYRMPTWKSWNLQQLLRFCEKTLAWSQLNTERKLYSISSIEWQIIDGSLWVCVTVILRTLCSWGLKTRIVFSIEFT